MTWVDNVKITKKLKFKISINNSCFCKSLVGCVNGDDYGTPDLSNDCVTIATTKEVSDIIAFLQQQQFSTPLLMLLIILKLMLHQVMKVETSINQFQ